MPQLRDFQSLPQAQAVMGDLVQEVRQDHFTAYICPRVLGRSRIDPVIIAACKQQGLAVLSYEAPNPTYDVHAIIEKAHWDAARNAVDALANAARMQGRI